MFNFCIEFHRVPNVTWYTSPLMKPPVYLTKKKESGLIALSTSCSWYERARNSTFCVIWQIYIIIDNENSDRIVLACIISRKRSVQLWRRNVKETGAKKWNFTWTVKVARNWSFQKLLSTNRYRSSTLNIYTIILGCYIYMYI